MSVTRRITIGLFVVILGAAVASGVLLHRSGYRAYIIHTGSMTGTYDTGDLVIDRPATSPIRVGEVITFLHSGLSNDLVTHRVVSLKDGTIQTKGDANKVKDTWNIRPDQVKGVVATSIPKAGFVAYFLKQRAGDAAAMTGLLALILLYGLIFTPDPPAREAPKSGASVALHAPDPPAREAPKSGASVALYVPEPARPGPHRRRPLPYPTPRPAELALTGS